MFVNRGAPQAIYLEDIDFGTEGGMATAADILVKQARARVRVDRLKEGQVKVCMIAYVCTYSITRGQ